MIEPITYYIYKSSYNHIKPDKTDQSSSSAEEDNSASGALIRWTEVFWTALKTHASGAGLDDERDKTN